MKILFLTSDKYPPFRPAAKVIFGKSLPKRGHIVDWLIQQADEFEDHGDAMEINGQVYMARTVSGESRMKRWLKYLADIQNDFDVFRLTRKKRYDLVLVKDKYIAGVLAALATRLSKTPFCFWLAYPHAEADIYASTHNTARYKWIYWIRGQCRKFALYKIILRTADHVFVQSQRMRLDLSEKGIEPKKMTPVPSSVAIEEYPVDDLLSWPERLQLHGERIVYFGTLQRERRLDFLVRVFEKVVKIRPDAKFDIIGRGNSPEDDALIDREITRLRLEGSVVRHGHLNPPDAIKIIKRSAVCLSPYYGIEILKSTSPTKLVEYLALARPVVATTHPEQDFVLSQCEGGISTPWDESAFAAAICSILENPQAGDEMGNRGRAYVEAERTDERMTDLVEHTCEATISNYGQ